MRLLLGHTYVAAKSDKSWPGRFARRTVVHVSKDGVVTYCRNERETSFKFHETSIEHFERWASESRTAALRETELRTRH